MFFKVRVTVSVDFMTRRCVTQPKRLRNGSLKIRNCDDSKSGGLLRVCGFFKNLDVVNVTGSGEVE